SGHLDREALVVADLAASRRHAGGKRRLRWRRPAPELPEGYRQGGAGVHARFRTPLDDHVLIGLRVGRNFEKTEIALRPIADRLNPQRRLQFPMRLIVVERIKGAAAL